MPISRRQFLQRTGRMTAGGLLASAWPGRPWLDAAYAAALGDRYFLIINLGGGNDGLSTLVPYENGHHGAYRTLYEQYRNASSSGGLRIPQSMLGQRLLGVDQATGTPLAWHPALGGMQDLWERGKVAVIQGCGYPEANLSHSESEQKWLTADPLGTGLGTGWMGRYLAARFGAAEIPAMSTQDRVPGEFIQSATGVLATARIEEFALPVDPGFPLDQDAKLAAYATLYRNARESTHTGMRYAGTVGGAMLGAAALFPPLHDLYESDRSTWSQEYSRANTETARSLREIAKTIHGVRQGKVNARFFEVLCGGYDTHSDQGPPNRSGEHYRLLSELGDALQIFYEDCADMGVADRLCILLWSEFGRRLVQNENGTDHGTQAPMFVIGGSVQGGLYGHHPNIEPGALDPTVPNTVYSQALADPQRSTDFRDVYGTVLKHWLNLSDAEVRAILPIDGGDPSLYWTRPDFDLPFLA